MPLIDNAREPDSTVADWRIWNTDIPEGHPTALRHSVAHVPGVHAFWDCWSLYLVHLRPVDGSPPASLQFPEAGHEIAFVAIEPTGPIDPDDPKTHRGMNPPDLVFQFGGMTDDQAGDLFDKAARYMLEARLPPDSDYASAWKGILSRTVEHILTGGHPPRGIG